MMDRYTKDNSAPADAGSAAGRNRSSFSLAIANLAVNDASPIPIYEQICCAIRSAITVGELPPKTLLPTSRELADALKIGRNTVVTAYSRLAAEGYLLTNKRRGTRVAEDALGIVPAFRDEHSVEAAERNSMRERDFPKSWHQANSVAISYRARQILGTCAGDASMAPFAPYLPDPALYPRNPLSRLLAEEFCHSPAGDLRTGFRKFQAAMANYLRHMRGVLCEPEQVIPITGLESALDLTGRVMIDPGDWVYVEDPASDVVRQSLHSAGAQLAPIPSDVGGADIGRAAGPPPRLIYVSPSVSFPFGRQMPEARREALLNAARSWNAVVFECDSLWELSYTGSRIKAVQGHDRNAPVIYFGSLNQTLGPHIRVGYLVVPPVLVEPFTDMAQRISYGPEPFVLAALATFIEDTDYAVHARSIRSIYAERLRALVEAVRTNIRDVVVLEPSGGLHLTVLFSDGIDEMKVCRAAADRGLSVTPLARFYHEPRMGSSQPGIVLGFGSLSDRVVETMVRRLAEVVAEVRAEYRTPALVA